MNKQSTKVMSGVLRVSRAILNRVEDAREGILVEDPDEASSLIDENDLLRQRFENTSLSSVSAQWDLDSEVVKNLHILSVICQSVETGASPALEDMELSFTCTLLGDEDQASSDISCGIIPLIKSGGTLFAFSYLEDYECVFNDEPPNLGA